jgi:hyperosmotically inducible protein
VTDYFLPKKKDETCGTTANLELLAKVKKDLIGDGDISSTQIEVKALQCNIILLGLVASANEINKATAHAKAVEGVRSVKSFLKNSDLLPESSPILEDTDTNISAKLAGLKKL